MLANMSLPHANTVANVNVGYNPRQTPIRNKVLDSVNQFGLFVSRDSLQWSKRRMPEAASSRLCSLHLRSNPKHTQRTSVSGAARLTRFTATRTAFNQ